MTSPIRQQLVYLAGAITGPSNQNCVSWREFSKLVLDERITALSPMRNKEYLSKEESITESIPGHAMSCAKGTMVRDRFDCMRADLVLVNLLNAERVSIETVMEIAWADAKRIPIVLIMEEKNIHQHGMIVEAAGFIVSSLEQALMTVERILLPDLGKTSYSSRKPAERGENAAYAQRHH